MALCYLPVAVSLTTAKTTTENHKVISFNKKTTAMGSNAVAQNLVKTSILDPFLLSSGGGFVLFS